MADQESMADYADYIDRSLRRIREGDILTGTVISVDEEEIILDLQYYAEGVIKCEDYSDEPGLNIKEEVSPGMEISATVVRTDDGSGRIQLSKKAANALLAWEKLKALEKSQTNVNVKVSSIVNKGVTAYLEGIRGFIPASKLALGYVEEEDLQQFVGRTIEVRVSLADEKEKKLILSSKEILRELAEEENKNKVSNIQVGLVTQGVVEKLQPYGAFVRLSNGISGLLHISQICEKRIKHPSAVLKEGETIKVKVIGIKDGKLSLSKKALEDVAAQEILEEAIVLPQSEALGSSLGDLLKGLSL